MSDDREAPEERAAIERCRRINGPYVQSQAASQRILGEQGIGRLTLAQISILADFREQIDLDGRRNVTDLADLVEQVRPVCICNERIAAVKNAYNQMLTSLGGARALVGQGEWVAALDARNRMLALIRAEHPRHSVKESPTQSAARLDALDMFGAAGDDLDGDR